MLRAWSCHFGGMGLRGVWSMLAAVSAEPKVGRRLCIAVLHQWSPPPPTLSVHQGVVQSKASSWGTMVLSCLLSCSRVVVSHGRGKGLRHDRL